MEPLTASQTMVKEIRYVLLDTQGTWLREVWESQRVSNLNF